MATRKLKFKPKPIVGGAVRRQREKEDLPESTLKETNSNDKEEQHNNTSLVNDSSDSTVKDDKTSTITLNDNCHSGESVSKKLKTEHSVDKSLSELPVYSGNNTFDCGFEKTNDHSSSVLYLPKEPVENVSSSITEEEISSTNNENTESIKLTDFSLSSLVSSNPTSGVDIEITKPNITSTVDPPESQKCTIDISGSKTDLTMDSSPSEDSIVSNNPTGKRDSGKGLTKFGRSRFKPVLNIAPRKKTNITESGMCESAPAANIRTESVIKCVKSALNKPNPIITEITESFSALESDEPDLHVTIKPIQNNAGGENVSSRPTSVTGTLNTNSHTSSEHSLGVQQDQTTNGDVNVNTTVNLCETDEQPSSNKTGQVLDNKANAESTSGNLQLIASNRVPTSPLKPTSKILVPKPCPNLLDTGVRRISFQGSDSEDEAKRKIHKTETSKPSSKEKKEKNIKNNKRKRSQGSTYSKLGQDTIQKFTQKFGKAEPDKTKLTMLDLIFYNPKSNPMSVSTDQVSALQRKEETIEVSEVVKEAIAEESVDDIEPETSAMPVPQLKVGPDGQVMLDPQSLVIETTEVKKNRAEMEKTAVIRETGITRYSTYSKKKHIRRDWSAQETLQFYRALNTIGSDFTLMATLFPKRSRHELKLKFKREEKTNMKLVDKAMTAPADFDFSSLEEELKRENEEIAKQDAEKKMAAETAKRERALRKEEKLNNTGKNKSLYRPIMAKGSAIKEFDETEIQSLEKPSNKKLCRNRKKKKSKSSKLVATDSEEEELEIDLYSEKEKRDNGLKVIKMIKEKTRAGRVIKRSKKLEEYEEINETLKRKFEEESDSEDDYTPNGPGADMLFGSPCKDPEEELEDKQWATDMSPEPCVEETDHVNSYVNEVTELSDLGSFGQNDTVLDLSLPLRTNMQNDVLRGDVPSNSVLSRHLISQSIQIIDQLTSGENLSVDRESEVDFSLSPTNLETVGSRTPLPSFESVSRSRPSVVYTVQTPYIPDKAEQQGSELTEGNDAPSIVFSNCYSDSEECILGD